MCREGGLGAAAPAADENCREMQLERDHPEQSNRTAFVRERRGEGEGKRGGEGR